MDRLTEYTGHGYVAYDPIDTKYDFSEINLQKLIDKLAHYEDLEEAGRLVELPYKAGDTVWVILSEQQKVEVWEVYRIIFAKEHDHIEFINGMCFTVWDKDWTFAKKFLFHTRKEAEEALKGAE